MKHRGSINQFNIERDRELIALYRQARATATYPTTMYELCKRTAKLPASCHYISDFYAYLYIRRRLAGDTKHFKRREQRILYESLYDIVGELLTKEKYKNHSLSRLVDIALAMPAPCIGLSPRTIQDKLCAFSKKKKK